MRPDFMISWWPKRIIRFDDRLGRFFDVRYLLKNFISGIDDSIIPAVQKRYKDQDAKFRQTNFTPTDLQFNEVLRNIATYTDTFRRDSQGETKKRRRNDNVNSVTTPTGSTSSSKPTIDATRGVVQTTTAQSVVVKRLPAPPTTLAIKSGWSDSSY